MVQDRFAALTFDADNALTGRIGLRLSRDVEHAGGLLQPYLKANLWHGFGGDDRVALNRTVIATGQDYNAFEFGGGVVARFNPNFSLYFVADYTVDLGSPQQDRETLGGNLGLRFDW